jgi:cytoskeletal protein RodZ
MNDATIRDAIRAVLIGAAAMTASVGWAQQAEPPTSVPDDDPATTQAPSRTDSNVDQTAPSPATSPNASATPIDDQKIDQFATAYVEVQKIQQKAASELDAAASDPAKQQQTQAKVENEMIAAVERTGLKLDEFNGIVQTMTADANLRARVVAKIRERMGG